MQLGILGAVLEHSIERFAGPLLLFGQSVPCVFHQFIAPMLKEVPVMTWIAIGRVERVLRQAPHSAPPPVVIGDQLRQDALDVITESASLRARFREVAAKE